MTLSGRISQCPSTLDSIIAVSDLQLGSLGGGSGKSRHCDILTSDSRRSSAEAPALGMDATRRKAGRPRMAEWPPRERSGFRSGSLSSSFHEPAGRGRASGLSAASTTLSASCTDLRKSGGDP